MKYLYIDTSADKVVLISKKPNKEMAANIDEYIVNDDFDLTKEMDDMENEGQKVRMEGFLTATEFLERYNSDYSSKRINEYPSMEEQLDNIFHNGVDAWKADIQAIKTAHPKP